jgi:hypothetical protein
MKLIYATAILIVVGASAVRGEDAPAPHVQDTVAISHFSLLAGGDFITNEDFKEALGAGHAGSDDAARVGVNFDLRVYQPLNMHVEFGGGYSWVRRESIPNQGGVRWNLSEASLGLRFYSAPQYDNYMAFFGLGLSMIHLEIDTDQPEQDDTAMGGYVKAGGYWLFAPGAAIGIEGRYRATERFDELGLQADGAQAAITFNIEF